MSQVSAPCHVPVVGRAASGCKLLGVSCLRAPHDHFLSQTSCCTFACPSSGAAREISAVGLGDARSRISRRTDDPLSQPARHFLDVILNPLSLANVEAAVLSFGNRSL